MMHAYFEDYLPLAQKNLGHMIDYAVNTCGFEANFFYNLFLKSPISKEFATGNPKYVAGMTGCELANLVFSDAGIVLNQKPIMYLDKSPEYWAGWAISYYQWYSAKSFSSIASIVTIDEIIYMYPTLHEADIIKFVMQIEKRI